MSAKENAFPFLGFIRELKNYSLEVSLTFVVDFYKGIRKSLVQDLDQLFLFARLCFVKRNKDLDAFERCFAFYFYDIDLPPVAEGDPELLNTKQFRDWLKEAWEGGKLEVHPNLLSADELMKRFWDVVREQMEAHHGGSKWVGTGGRSAFGHSGAAQPGIRVHGSAKNFSAVKVIGNRNYISYSRCNSLKDDNIRVAIETLKHLEKVGANSHLDIEETIDKTSKNGGEIDLVFERDEINKLKVILLIDNGGSSMNWHVAETTKLFKKMQSHFKSIETYYFHNTIYGFVFKDQRRRHAISTYKLLQKDGKTRVFIVGDASMSPNELISNYGNINYGDEEYDASTDWLVRLKKRFEHIVWLNPIRKEDWNRSYGIYSISKISEIIQMEDMTLGGLKRSVDYMNSRSV